MTKPKQIHTTHRPSGWGNITPGASKPAKIYPTKVEAQAAGREQAIRNNAEHIIHNLNGQIAQRNSYGNDPNPPRG